MESSSENQVGSCLLGEEDLQDDLSRFCEFRYHVKNRLALIAQAYNTQTFNIVFQNQ